MAVSAMTCCLAGTATTSFSAVTVATRLVGGLGRDIMNGGAGADIFRFDDMDAGDATAGQLSDVIHGFSSDDVLDLMAVDILYFWGYRRSGALGAEAFSIWQTGGNTYVTWNTFNGFHDIELAGFQGDPSRSDPSGMKTTTLRTSIPRAALPLARRGRVPSRYGRGCGLVPDQSFEEPASTMFDLQGQADRRRYPARVLT